LDLIGKTLRSENSCVENGLLVVVVELSERRPAGLCGKLQ
jgi:hypothetical protein